MSKISIIVPWFGEHCRGGAETLAQEVYSLLNELSHVVEVVTTTGKNFQSDWSTAFYSEGVAVSGGFITRRFDPATRDVSRFDKINGKLLRGEWISEVEESVFVHENVNSLGLNRYVAQGNQDVYVYLPYLYGTTTFGLMNNSGKNLVIPLLHDESYLRIRPIQRSLRFADGVVFVSEAERDLWREVFGTLPERHWVIPVPIEKPKWIPTEQVNNEVPFERYFLFAGRKDAGKNIGFLFDMLRAMDDTSIGCTLVGGGDVDVPADVRDRVIDMGYVSERAKAALMRGAVCLVQPSRFESFSIVTAEANMAGVPVIVNSECSVLRRYIQQSGGGIHTTSPAEAADTIKRWLDVPEEAQGIGKAGQWYVQVHFTREVALKAYDEAITALTR